MEDRVALEVVVVGEFEEGFVGKGSTNFKEEDQERNIWTSKRWYLYLWIIGDLYVEISRS